jgi:hypothetical protein
VTASRVQEPLRQDPSQGPTLDAAPSLVASSPTRAKACSVHARSSARVRPHQTLVRGVAVAIGQEAHGGGGVVKANARPREGDAGTRFVDGERRFEHIVERAAGYVKQQVAKVVVAIHPGGAVIVVDATHAERFRIEHRIVKPEIAVNERTIAGGDLHGFAHLEQPLTARVKRAEEDHRDESIEIGHTRCIRQLERSS